VGLKLAGQTINTITLGGIALAVGMLVDDATVEIENIHRNHAMNKPLLVAILDGASQIATPTFVGTLGQIKTDLPQSEVCVYPSLPRPAQGDDSTGVNVWIGLSR